jgi:hypothetical protein
MKCMIKDLATEVAKIIISCKVIDELMLIWYLTAVVHRMKLFICVQILH